MEVPVNRSTDCRLCGSQNIRLRLPAGSDWKVAVCPICDLGLTSETVEEIETND